MTNTNSLLALGIFISFLLLGCSHDTNDSQSKNELGVIASEKTLPPNFHELAFERNTAPSFQYLVRRAVDQFQLAQGWGLYRFKTNIPMVDFKRKEVFFIGFHESGSCPNQIKNIEFRSTNKTMTVVLTEPQGNCTSDATPRTIVISVDKEVYKDIEEVGIVQNGVVTNIPLEN